jgi:hypothetical protein
MPENELAEIIVHGDQNPVFPVGARQHLGITRIRRARRNLDDISPRSRNDCAASRVTQLSTRNLKPG